MDKNNPDTAVSNSGLNKVEFPSWEVDPINFFSTNLEGIQKIDSCISDRSFCLAEVSENKQVYVWYPRRYIQTLRQVNWLRRQEWHRQLISVRQYREWMRQDGFIFCKNPENYLLGLAKVLATQVVPKELRETRIVAFNPELANQSAVRNYTYYFPVIDYQYNNRVLSTACTIQKIDSILVEKIV